MFSQILEQANRPASTSSNFSDFATCRELSPSHDTFSPTLQVAL
jgi:hypothetical protein